MSQRLKSILAVWFVLQIVLPFTAPLQTCDLGDLLGTTHHHGAPASHESSTTPTISEANTFVSPLAASTLRASASLAALCYDTVSRPLASTFGLSPSPQVQQTVLRV